MIRRECTINAGYPIQLAWTFIHGIWLQLFYQIPNIPFLWNPCVHVILTFFFPGSVLHFSAGLYFGQYCLEYCCRIRFIAGSALTFVTFLSGIALKKSPHSSAFKMSSTLKPLPKSGNLVMNSSTTSTGTSFDSPHKTFWEISCRSLNFSSQPLDAWKSFTPNSCANFLAIYIRT